MTRNPANKTGRFNNLKLRNATAQDAAEVARLHIQGINTGFISSLGSEFVISLYKAITRDRSSFSFVAEENGRILGFTAFTADLGKLYRAIVLKKGLWFVLLLAGKMFSLKRLRKVFQTLFYPGRMKKMALPRAELLSIVVAEEARGEGLAGRLIEKGLEECERRGIDSVKVMVGAGNEPANNLYLKCGFKPVGQIDSHRVLTNIYVARTGPA